MTVRKIVERHQKPDVLFLDDLKETGFLGVISETGDKMMCVKDSHGFWNILQLPRPNIHDGAPFIRRVSGNEQRTLQQTMTNYDDCDSSLRKFRCDTLEEFAAVKYEDLG